MSENDPKAAWENLLQQLTSPWDWCFLIAGASVGLLTAYLAAWELGTIAAASGGIAIAIRRAFVASFNGMWLERRAAKLIEFLEREAHGARRERPTDDPEISSYRWFFDAGDCTTLRAAVDRDLTLYSDGVTTKAQFEESLNEHLNSIRKLTVQQEVVGEPLAPATGPREETEVETAREEKEVEAFRESFSDEGDEGGPHLKPR